MNQFDQWLNEKYRQPAAPAAPTTDEQWYILFHSKYRYEDGQLISKHMGRAVTAMQSNDSGLRYLYCETQIGGRRYKHKVHRVIYCMHHGVLPDIVDHIDGNTLNNNINNLRAATHQQNSWNRKVSSRNKLGVKGVVYQKVGNSSKWRYVVYHKGSDGRNRRLGSFETLEEAARAYESAARNVQGSFYCNR